MPAAVKSTGNHQVKTQEKKATSTRPAGSSTRSSAAVLNPMCFRWMKSGSTKTSSTMSLVKLSQGVRLRPTEPFMASPKQPQSVTQVTPRVTSAPSTITV